MAFKVAYIGSEDYYDIFKEEEPDWDWQIPSVDAEDFDANLDAGKIDDETSMLIFDPALYDPTHQDTSFDELIAQMSPYALCVVIAFNDPEDTTPKSDIQDAVNAQSDANEGAHFYWLDAEDIVRSLEENIGDYVNAGDSDKDVVSVIVEELGLAAPEEPVEETPKKRGRSRDVFADEEDTYDESEDEGFTNALGRKGTIICVTSAKGGSGKSTVAFTLAQEIGKTTYTAAQQGEIKKPLKVCLVDMDVYDGQLGFVIGASQPTMLSIAQEPRINQQSVGKNLITNDIVQRSKRQEGRFIYFDALLAPKSPRYVEETPADLWERVITILSSMYDVVILDTSVMYFLDPIIYSVAYPIADKLLYVTDLDIKSILDTTKWMQHVCTPEEASGFGIALEKVGIVINKGMKEVGMEHSKIKKILKVATHQVYQLIDKTIPVDDLPVPRVLTTVPSFPKLITGASNNQNLGAIIDLEPIEKSFRILAKAVLPRDIASKIPNPPQHQ